jgi:hypothetical protein
MSTAVDIWWCGTVTMSGAVPVRCAAKNLSVRIRFRGLATILAPGSFASKPVTNLAATFSRRSRADDGSNRDQGRTTVAPAARTAGANGVAPTPAVTARRNTPLAFAWFRIRSPEVRRAASRGGRFGAGSIGPTL